MGLDENAHAPVLLGAAVEALQVQSAGIYMDCTFGRGGHTLAILAQLGERGRMLAMDRDAAAVAVARDRFGADHRLTTEQGDFSMLDAMTSQCGVTGKVNGILFDLGMSSPQLDDPQRGFSFMRDGPLDMRMDASRGITAAQWLAKTSSRELARVLKDFGEERFAKRIARAITELCAKNPLTTTRQLATVIEQAVPKREKGIHPATRSFQAIRIFINDELGALRHALAQVHAVLAPGGRLVVISFHSLEDRIVKRFMREQAKGDDFPPDMPVTVDQMRPPRMRLIGKALRPTEAEVAANPRARSAVLRVAEKCA